MSTVPPAIQDLARRLLALEAARRQPSTAGAGDAVQVCETLRGVLTRFAGAAAFSSLLSRALTLAKADNPSLSAVRVRADGCLEGFEKVSHGQAADTPGDEDVALVAQLLGLMVSFIGRPLTLRLLHDAWPDAVMDTRDSKRGGEHGRQ